MAEDSGAGDGVSSGLSVPYWKDPARVGRAYGGPGERMGGPEDVRDAWSVLAGSSVAAAESLAEISKHGRSEQARVLASNAILDRVGLAPVKEVAFRVMPQEGSDGKALNSQADIVRSRLDTLRQDGLKVLEAAVLSEAVEESDVETVDAEWTAET